MADATGTGEAERSPGRPYGRIFTVRKSYLGMLETNLGRQCADEQAGIIPGHFYDNISGETVRVQLTVFKADGGQGNG